MHQGSTESAPSTPKQSTIAPTSPLSEVSEQAMSQMVKVSSSEELKGCLNRRKGAGVLVVVEFVASWCGLCKVVAPQMEVMKLGVTFLRW